MKNVINMSGYDSAFATRFRELMNENKDGNKKVTQKAMADVIGGSRQVISQYMNGIVSPQIDKLEKIADFFDVSCDYLLGRTNIKTPNITIQAVHKLTGLSETAISTLIENIETTRYIIQNDYPEDSEETIETMVNKHSVIKWQNILLEKNLIGYISAILEMYSVLYEKEKINSAENADAKQFDNLILLNNVCNADSYEIKIPQSYAFELFEVLIKDSFAEFINNYLAKHYNNQK